MGRTESLTKSSPAMTGETISDHDRRHIHDFLRGYGDWFTAQLIRLCAKADRENLERIRQGFPQTVAAYEAWYYKTGIYEGVEA